MPTKIEWTGETWNPVTGCTPISPGCAHCYAARMAKRLAGRCGYPPAPHQFDVTLHPDQLLKPMCWRKPRMVFVCSMGDLFHDDVPDEFIHRVWRTMAQAPQHTYQLLTKRPERARAISNHYCWAWPNNVWLGITAEDQAQFFLRWQFSKRCPAAVHFVSYEPGLGALVLPPDFLALGQRGWVICGGETGPGARPMHPDWARSLRDQCADAGVPFFFKQWGSYTELPTPSDAKGDGRYRIVEADGEVHVIDHSCRVMGIGTGAALMHRIGKKRAGHLLDGVEHREYPGVHHA